MREGGRWPPRLRGFIVICNGKIQFDWSHICCIFSLCLIWVCKIQISSLIFIHVFHCRRSAILQPFDFDTRASFFLRSSVSEFWPRGTAFRPARSARCDLSLKFLSASDFSILSWFQTAWANLVSSSHQGLVLIQTALLISRSQDSCSVARSSTSRSVSFACSVLLPGHFFSRCHRLWTLLICITQSSSLWCWRLVTSLSSPAHEWICSLRCLIVFTAVMHRFIDLLCFEWELLQGNTGIALESPDQTTWGFVVQIALPRRFSERVHQVFGEMPEDINCSLFWFLSSIPHVVLLALIRVLAAIPNPILRTDGCSIAMRSRRS
jgi:hypothetical protein